MIREFRRIVVGVELSETGDLSAGSQLAVEQARWVAKIGGAQVTLLHSIRREEHWRVSEGVFADRPVSAEDGFRQSLETVLGSLREATTALKQSPPIFDTMDILGREKVIARIKLAIEQLES